MDVISSRILSVALGVSTSLRQTRSTCMLAEVISAAASRLEERQFGSKHLDNKFLLF